MFSLPAFLGTLPPASLAEADLPRFATRALNRRTLDELPGVRAILLEEPLPGYPPALAKALVVLLDRLLAAEVDPGGLDPEQVERLLGGPEALAELERRRALDRTVLRPGMVVTPEIRDLLGGRMEIVPGEGGQLVLVGPADVVRMSGLGWSALRTPALARLMDAAEAEGLRDAWATVEEYTGWPRRSALPWEARFVRTALRPNPDARKVTGLLRELAPPRRTALWRVLLEHLRDEDLPDGHRPGRRGLVRRLEAAGVRVTDEALEALVAFARAMADRCGRDALVARGLCSCTEADLAAYSDWIEVPEGARARLRAMEPALVEHHLRTLAAVDHGAIQTRLDPALGRDLRGLRDAYLRHRYRRDLTPLLGVDPLPLAEARLEAGEDRSAILQELARLAQEARRQGPAEREEQEPTPPGKDQAGPSAEAEAPEAAEVPEVPEEGRPEPSEEPPPEPPPLLEEAAPPARPPADRPPTGANPFARRGARPPSERMPTVPPPADLPPLPKPPPPRRRPLTRRSRELPPMPEAPPPRPPRTRPPTSRPRTRPAPAGAPRPAPEPPPESPQQREAPPPRPATDRPRTSRPGTVPHLTTPGQATEFYEAAFREMEVLERDLLERGPWEAARQRVQALSARAHELIQALGPPARSGDAAFQGALHKVELVRAYLDRIRPLLEEAPRGPAEPEPPPEEHPGVLGRLGRLLKRERDDE